MKKYEKVIHEMSNQHQNITIIEEHHCNIDNSDFNINTYLIIKEPNKLIQSWPDYAIRPMNLMQNNTKYEYVGTVIDDLCRVNNLEKLGLKCIQKEAQFTNLP